MNWKVVHQISRFIFGLHWSHLLRNEASFRCALLMISRKCSKPHQKASCHLDPTLTSILHQLSCLLPVITNIVNQLLTAGHFPSQLQSAIVKPLLKKSTLDPENLKSFRPVSKLLFISKIIEKSNCKSVTQTYGRKRFP